MKTVILLTELTLSTLQAQELARAREIAIRLAASPIPVDISSARSVDPSVPQLMARLKSELRTWVSAKVIELPARPEPARVEQMMRKALNDSGLMGDHMLHPFGKILNQSISFTHDEQLMLVVISYDGYCPPDDSVLFFELSYDRTWHLTLSSDNTEFQHPWGNRKLLFADLAPRDGKGQAYALVVKTRSYCPGVGGSPAMDFFVLQPGVAADSAKELFRGSLGYRDIEDFRIALGKGGFTLDFPGWGRNPSLTRTHVLKYVVEESGVRRVQPVAVSATGFVEEWLSSPWTAARTWSNPQQTSQLANWHEKLGSRITTDQLGFQPFLQTCVSGQKLSQVTFPRAFPSSGPSPGDLYFLVQETARRVYKLMAVGTQTARACSEPEPDDSQDEHLLPPSFNIFKRTPNR